MSKRGCGSRFDTFGAQLGQERKCSATESAAIGRDYSFPFCRRGSRLCRGDRSAREQGDLSACFDLPRCLGICVVVQDIMFSGWIGFRGLFLFLHIREVGASLYFGEFVLERMDYR